MVDFAVMPPLSALHSNGCTVFRNQHIDVIKIGIPLLAGLSAVHGLVPPHPGPLLAIGIFGADIGKTILYGLIVALPTAIIAGPIFGTFIAKHIPGHPNQELVDQLARETNTAPKSSPAPSPAPSPAEKETCAPEHRAAGHC